MKESKGVYVTKRDIRQNRLQTEYQLYTNYNNIGNNRLTNDVGVQYNSRRNNAHAYRNLSGVRKYHEPRYFSPSPKQIYTYHRSRSYTEIGVGSVKALQKKKVKRIYLPETDDRGVGSSDLTSLISRKVIGKPKYSRGFGFYESKKTSSKCVGGAVELPVESLVSAKLSPIIHTKSGTTSPHNFEPQKSVKEVKEIRDMEIGSTFIEKILVTATTQFEETEVVEDYLPVGTEVKDQTDQKDEIDEQVNKIDEIDQIDQLDQRDQGDQLDQYHVASFNDEPDMEVAQISSKLSKHKEIATEVEMPKEKGLRESFSSDSLVQHVHNLEQPSEYNKPSIDPMENKMEREYRKMFVTKTKEEKPVVVEKPLPQKSTSMFRRRFTALRKSLGKKEEPAPVQNQPSVPSVRDASVTSDPPSLEGRSFSSVKAFTSNTNRNERTSRKDSYKKSYTGKKGSKTWTKPNPIDSEYVNGQSVKGMFKLWGKKFNLDDSSYRKDSDSPNTSFEGKQGKIKENKKGEGIEIRVSGPGESKATNEKENKKEGKKFFFFKKKQSKDKPRSQPAPSYKNKTGVTTGRCEVRDGLTIKIGAAPIPPPPVKQKSQPLENINDLVRAAWLMKYLTTPIESRNSVKIRWNNGLYATSSSTVFELMENVYKNTGVILKSKSEITTDISSYYKSYTDQHSVNFMQNVEAWMVPNMVPDHRPPVNVGNRSSNNIVTKSKNTNENENNIEVTISDQKWFIDKSKAFAHKIEVVLHSKNFVKLHNPEVSSEYLRIDIPKGFFSDTSSDEAPALQTSDEEVYKIVEYESDRPDEQVQQKVNSKVSHSGDHEDKTEDIKVTVSVRDGSCKESKILETVIKRPPTHRDVVIQGSNVYIPKMCDVIGVGIITQRDAREFRKPRLRIMDYLSGDESEHSIARLRPTNCVLAESYLQEYYREFQPLGIDLFSCCHSDSHIECCSNSSKLSYVNDDGSKSCPNIFERYITVMSSKAEVEKCCDEAKKDKKKEKKEKKQSDKDKIDEFRVHPKDSLEVFKRRKIYAVGKLKWHCEECCENSSNSSPGNAGGISSQQKPDAKGRPRKFMDHTPESCGKPEVHGILVWGKECKKPNKMKVCMDDAAVCRIPSSCCSQKTTKCSKCEKFPPCPPHIAVCKPEPRPDCFDSEPLPKKKKDKKGEDHEPPEYCRNCKTPECAKSHPFTKALPPCTPDHPKPCCPPNVECGHKPKFETNHRHHTPSCQSESQTCLDPLPPHHSPICTPPRSPPDSSTGSPRQSPPCSPPRSPPGSPPRSPPRSPPKSSPKNKCVSGVKLSNTDCIQYPPVFTPPSKPCSPPYPEPVCPPRSKSCPPKPSRETKPPRPSKLSCPKPYPKTCSLPKCPHAPTCKVPPCPYAAQPPSPPPTCCKYGPQKNSSKSSDVCFNQVLSSSMLHHMSSDHVSVTSRGLPNYAPESGHYHSPSSCHENCYSTQQHSYHNSERRREDGNLPPNTSESIQRSSRRSCNCPQSSQSIPQVNTESSDQQYPWPVNNRVSNQCSDSSVIHTHHEECSGYYREPNNSNMQRSITGKRRPIQREKICESDTSDIPECVQHLSKSPSAPAPFTLGECSSAERIVPPQNQESFQECQRKQTSRTKSLLSGVFLRKFPSKRKANKEKNVIRLNSKEQITFKLRNETPSTQELRSCVIRDDDDVTLVERKDYHQSGAVKQIAPLLDNLYKSSRVVTPITVNEVASVEREKEVTKIKSDASVANVIEINFKLKVTQGDKTTEINIGKDDNLEHKHNISDRAKEVYVLKNASSLEETNPKNDLNIRILIKSYKPKSEGKNITSTVNAFSEKISKKFKSVSTGYSDLREECPDTVFSIHRATIDLTSSTEKAKITKFSEETSSQALTEKSSKGISVIENTSTKGNSAIKFDCSSSSSESIEPRTNSLPLIHNSLPVLQTTCSPIQSPIHPASLHSAHEDSVRKLSRSLANKLSKSEEEFTSEKTVSGDASNSEPIPLKTTKRAVEVKNIFKATAQMSFTDTEDISIGNKTSDEPTDLLVKTSEEPTDLLTKTSEEPIGPNLRTSDERTDQTDGKTSEDAESFSKTSEILEVRKAGSCEIYTEIRKSKKDEKKEMLKQVFDGAECFKKPKNKTRIQRLKDMLKAILTSDSDPETEPISVTERELIKDIIKPDIIVNSDSLNNLYQRGSLMVSHTVSHSKNYPSADMCSCQSEISEDEEKVQNKTCLCSSFAAKLLGNNAGGGCCCRRAPIKIDEEISCDLREQLSLNDFSFLAPSVECIHVQTENSRYKNSFHISQPILDGKRTLIIDPKYPDDTIAIVESNIEEFASPPLKEMESHRSRKSDCKEEKRRSTHVRETEIRSLSTKTQLNISDEDKIIVVEKTTTKQRAVHKKKKKKSKHKTEFHNGADVLQMYETKKAVLEIYAEKTVTDDGEHLVAKLPKFVYDTESQLYENYDGLDQHSYRSVCKRNFVMMCIGR